MPFNRYITVAEFAPVAAFIRAAGESVRFDGGDCFARQDVRNRYSGLVCSGAFRYVHETAEGARHVVGYAFAGEFVGDYISMRMDNPSWVRIEAMCGSEVRRVANGELEAFFRTDAGHERLGRRLAEHLLAEVYERLLQSYAATPRTRYEALLRRCPGLLELVPLKELASYLHVRPETLSRIRRRVR